VKHIENLVKPIAEMGIEAMCTYDLELLEIYNEERASLYYCYKKELLDELFTKYEDLG